MKAVHGNVADIKKIRSRAVVAIHVEIPVESYAAAVAMLDEKDVLITIAPKDVGPYGVIACEDEDNTTDEYAGSASIPPSTTKIDHKNSQLAAMYCKNEVFRQWLSCGGNVTESVIREHILKVCHIKSRAELDTDMEAQKIFIDRYCKPYTAYMRDR